MSVASFATETTASTCRRLRRRFRFFPRPSLRWGSNGVLRPWFSDVAQAADVVLTDLSDPQLPRPPPSCPPLASLPGLLPLSKRQRHGSTLPASRATPSFRSG